ncbi:hypothetical protein FRC17_008237 [Serendipita sp. 399]|nr:hypothetical protein FRC17_008237 [Serendipita sp. 399]
MAFTAGCAFSKPLARIVINGGMALTLTSIACNRVIFAFRGLLTEFNEGQSRSRPNPPPSHRGKFVDDTNRTQEENGVFTTDAEALDDEYIAYTRHDMTTRELASRDDSQSERTTRKVPASPLSMRSDEPSTKQVSWRAEKNRPRRFEFPFRSHQASTSTDLTRESIPEGGAGTTESGRLARPEMQRPSLPSLNSQTPLNPTSPATDAVTTPTTDSSSRFAKPLLSPTSLKSMARSALRSPPTSPSSQVFNMPISESISDGGGAKSHQGSGSVSFSTSPVSAEHVRRTISSSGTKRHSFWWSRPGSKGSVGADALSIAERAGVGHDVEGRDGLDVVGNAGDDRMMELTLRPRGRERHPLDHQYEMDTLYPDPIDRILDDD